MFRSQPISMMQGGQQLSTIKLAVCYIYTAGGIHDLNSVTYSQSLRLKIYGIDKTGKTLLAICPLTTITGYGANEYAASVITGIKVEEYNSIFFEYDIKEVDYEVSDFNKIVGSPIMFVDVKVLPDVMQANNFTTAVGA